MWWKSAVNLSFFLSLATFRMRSSACATLIRFCARHVLCWSAFPSASVLGSPSSAAAGPSMDCSTAGYAALFAGFAATMTEPDLSCPFIIGYGSSPSRCGPPDSAHSTRRRRPDMRYPRFRCDPFARDVAFDPGRATAPRITVPHMLPSSEQRLSAPAISDLSWLNPTPHAIAVYASQPLSPVATQHSLPSRRYSLLGPDFHRLDRTSFAWRTHSITSSARASNVGGTVRPTALAVLRLMNSSTLVGCWTGISTGFAPLRILSTKS